MSHEHASSDALTPHEPIAIVGVACRFPGGAHTPEALWQLLAEGRDAITQIARDGIELERFYDARPATPGRMFSRWGGFLDGLEQFDAEFFGISPREAESLDPAQRLLLETAWEALEDASIEPGALRAEPVGVFVGQWLNDFESRLFADTDALDLYATTGSGRYAASGRLSYFFGFTGPSLTLDTACSSSLVAIHLACQSLRAGESSLAIAAGVNVILQPHISIAYSQSGMMAPDGHCKFGDAKGDGYVRSEGAGVVLLKPLSKALADGDPIRAVIRGSAVNNDGRGSGHLATPSRAGQAAMLRRAYADAGVSPGRVGYVEAHGTGTRAGDPIELGALGDVLTADRHASLRCLVGSVKTNIGHTEGAAGMAGVLKTVLALQHREVPANLHLNELNPLVPWAELPFDLPRERRAWPDPGAPRLAGVSGFGITGTNAHVVLEEAPARQARRATAPRVLPLILSAMTPAALQALASSYAEALSAEPDVELADVCGTAACQRAALDHRAVFVAADRDALVDKLRRFAAGDAIAAEATGRVGAAPRRIAFVFSGQGGQWLGMGRELLATEAVFRDAITRCDAAMPAGRGWSVLEQLGLDAEAPGYRLGEIGVLQPTLLALEIALAEWWGAHGIEAEAVVGHSLGEAGAAYFAGALSLADAMLVICTRSALMQRTSGAGAMALIGLGAEATQERIAGRAELMSMAASNGPRSTIVSGQPAAVAALLKELEAEAVFCRAVQVDVASHSPQMQPLVSELVSALRGVQSGPFARAMYSTVLARKLTVGECAAEYWGRNLRQPVLFAKAAATMLADGIDAFIEVGPHPTLLASVAEVGAESAPLTLASVRRAEPERAALLASFGALWIAGQPVDWAKIFEPGSYARVPLPHYPWQRERHWSSSALPVTGEGGGKRAAPLDDTLRSWLYISRWEALASESAAEARLNWLIVGEAAWSGALATSLRESGATAEAVATVEGALAWLGAADPARVRGLGIALCVAPSDSRAAWQAVSALQDLQRVWGVAEAAPRVWWLTTGAQAVPGTASALAPAQAAVWGAGRVMAAEHPSWWGGLLDLSASPSPEELQVAARHLRSSCNEDQVAVRGTARYALRFVPAEAPAMSGYRWRPDAAYLLTGGLGGIALELAQAMVAAGARRLILLGRTALPPRSVWAAEPATTALGRRIAAVRALEHAGAALHLMHADMADAAQVRAALDAYRAEGWPPIAGVIHGAAVTDNRLTPDMDAAAFARVLAPKLAGAQVLDELLPELDLFVLLSSMSAFWGPAGMSNYAAANAGLDALAQARRARGQHALSIQWGYWANIGLSEGALAERNAEDLARVGVGAMSGAQGSAVFLALLSRPEAVLAVLPIDWAKFRQARRGRDWPLFRVAAGTDSASSNDSFAERARGASVLARRALIEAMVREALGAVLHRPAKQLDARRSFGSVGLDSLMALELRNRLERALECPLPATLAWNYPTIEQLSAHLCEQMAGESAIVAAPSAALTPADLDVASLFDGIAALSDADAALALRGGG
ncbi:MAG: type I polyketide synthase [Pseudomonadota bacterium]